MAHKGRLGVVELGLELCEGGCGERCRKLGQFRGSWWEVEQGGGNMAKAVDWRAVVIV